METTTLFRNAVKNPVSAIVVLMMAVVMAYLIVGDVNRMQAATTNYEYCQNLCYLVDNIARTYFCSLFLMMAYLTYIHKQYTKWTIWLFSLIGISALVYFLVAGNVYEYVFNHVEADYQDHLPSMARTLFLGPTYWIIIGYFLVPKILKDAQKLKEEQDLTV